MTTETARPALSGNPPGAVGAGAGIKVCMFVLNNCRHDSRVLKEAQSLAGAGYQVRILALKDPDTPAFEERDGFSIQRIDVSPPGVQAPARRKRLRRLARLPGRALNRVATLLSVPSGSLRFYRQSLRILREDPAHIYHGHD